MLFNPTIETMPLPELRRLQSARFVELVQFMYARQPFYRQQWDEAGINITKIRSVEDIRQFPFTRKDDLRDNYPFGLFALPAEIKGRFGRLRSVVGKVNPIHLDQQDTSDYPLVIQEYLGIDGWFRSGVEVSRLFSPFTETWTHDLLFGVVEELIDDLLVERGLFAGQLGVGNLFDLVGEVGQQAPVGLCAPQDEWLRGPPQPSRG